MSYNIMIWNWKWKKMLLSISFKYSYFNPIFNYTRKGLWKGILICQNCDTLMCFHPKVYMLLNHKAYSLRFKSLPHTCTCPHLIHKQDWSLWHMSLYSFSLKHGHSHSKVVHTPPSLNWQFALASHQTYCHWFHVTTWHV